MNLFRLDNKVAIIPGAAGAIGSATAQLLLADVSFEKVSDLAHSLDSKVLALKADFSLVSDCQAAVETATKHFGRLDILINNVGVCPRIPFLDSTEGDWEHVVAINQRSMFFCSQAAAPHLKKSRGRIVSLAS